MPRKQTPPLADALVEYLASPRIRAMAADTLRNHAGVLRRLTMALGPQRRVQYIEATEVAVWLWDLAKRGRAPGTINLQRTVIRGFNRWCVSRRYTAADWLTEFPEEADAPRDWVYLTPDQLINLTERADHPRDRILLALAVNTARRISEILPLRVSDLDLEGKRIRFMLLKKRSRVPYVYYAPISQDLDNELQTWLTFYRQECGPLQNDWLVAPSKGRHRFAPDPDTGRLGHVPGTPQPMTRITNQDGIIRRAYRRIGYDMPVGEGWHSLRRSAARIYFESQMQAGDPYVHALRRTMAWLQHATISQTEHYLGLSADKEAVERDFAGRPFLSALAQPSTSASVISLASRRR